jgi:subtilisin family serine protease
MVFRVLLIGLTALTAGAAEVKYLLKYRSNSSAVANQVRSAGGTVITDYTPIGMLLVRSSAANFAARLSAHAAVEYVVPDARVQAVRRPAATAAISVPPALPAAASPFSAPRYPLQWNLHKVLANLAWGVTLGSPEVKVAVLDTGICAHHIDLAGKVDPWASASFVPVADECPDSAAPACIGCPSWEDRNYHGSHVAGIISTNNKGSAGIAPAVRLRAVKVANCRGETEWNWLIAGILWAAVTGNDVINISLSAEFERNAPGAQLLIRALKTAIDFAEDRGTLVVTSAGNAALDLDRAGRLVSMPCEAGGLCVGATTISDQLADYSNHGKTAVSLVAPGGGTPIGNFPPTSANLAVYGPCSRHTTVFANPCASADFTFLVSGTSQAAPLVAGTAALIDSAGRRPGSADAKDLKQAILRGADDLGHNGPDNIYSRGRLNAYRALQ